MHQPFKARDKLHFLFISQQWTKVRSHFITATCGRNYCTKPTRWQITTGHVLIMFRTVSLRVHETCVLYCTFISVLSDSSLVSCSSMFWTRPSSLSCCLISMACGEMAHKRWIRQMNHNRIQRKIEKNIYVQTLSYNSDLCCDLSKPGCYSWVTKTTSSTILIGRRTEQLPAATTCIYRWGKHKQRQTQLHKSISDCFWVSRGLCYIKWSPLLGPAYFLCGLNQAAKRARGQ